MITLHFHLQPQYKYELFHINFIPLTCVCGKPDCKNYTVIMFCSHNHFQFHINLITEFFIQLTQKNFQLILLISHLNLQPTFWWQVYTEKPKCLNYFYLTRLAFCHVKTCPSPDKWPTEYLQTKIICRLQVPGFQISWVALFRFCIQWPWEMIRNGNFCNQISCSVWTQIKENGNTVVKSKEQQTNCLPLMISHVRETTRSSRNYVSCAQHQEVTNALKQLKNSQFENLNDIYRILMSMFAACKWS